MTTQADHIIEDFGALPDQEKREVLAQLIRIARHIDQLSFVRFRMPVLLVLPFARVGWTHCPKHIG